MNAYMPLLPIVLLGLFAALAGGFSLWRAEVLDKKEALERREKKRVVASKEPTVLSH
jgi:hypothetical protein